MRGSGVSTAEDVRLRSWDKLFIGGSWVEPSSRDVIEVVSPVTEQVIATVPDPQVADVDKAVAAAKRAFDEGVWRSRPVNERAGALERVADAIEANATEFDAAFTAEIGGPLSGSPFLQRLAVDIWRDYADQVRKFEFEQERGGVARIIHEPVGVVAALVPWNGVNPVAGWKLAAALAAGCSVVLKPAPEGPVTSYLLAEALDKAGFPAGIVSVLPGGLEAGKHLVCHPDVQAVSFTGSSAAGKQIMASTAQNLTRLTLELGGKSAAIIADDVDFDEVLPNILFGWLGNCGQVCIALSRWLVPRARHDEFVEKLKAFVESQVVGDPFHPETTVGPMATEAQRRKTEEFIALGRSEGATLVTGGGRPDGLKKGWFIEPTVFANVENGMRIAQEEIFGPVLCVIPYDDIDDAIRIANDSPYGLAGSVFTNDDAIADRVSRGVRSGTFSINHAGTCVTQPFGGFKNSGIGREGGVEGLRSFLETKTINLLPS